MRGTAVESQSSGHHDCVGEERLAQAEEKKRPVSSAVLVMIAISVLLWAAVYFGVQKFL